MCDGAFEGRTVATSNQVSIARRFGGDGRGGDAERVVTMSCHASVAPQWQDQTAPGVSGASLGHSSPSWRRRLWCGCQFCKRICFDCGDDKIGAAAACTDAIATSESHEQRWLWKELVANAAASEVAINVCLPLLVCQRGNAGWEAPSDVLLGFLVLLLNLSGTFLEGFCKSLRLLSQTLRRTKASHQLVFVTSQSLSGGFLNVVTSFPDIADIGGNVVAMTNNWSLGGLYCLAHIVGGVLLYKLGRDIGWRSARRDWGFILRSCRVWNAFVRCLVFFVALALALLETFPGVLGNPARQFSGSFAKGGRNHVPLDLSQPGHPGLRRPSHSVAEQPGLYDIEVETGVRALLGLAVGIFMSVSGALVATLFSEVLFKSRGRPFARFVANFAATVLVIILQPAPAEMPGVSRWVNASFVTLKFSTSFCGALSAFSGTIGDVTDAYFGSADEESTLEGAWRCGKKRGRGWGLPLLSGAQNLLAHGSLIVAVMMLSGNAGQVADNNVHSTIIVSEQPHWVREREWVTWHAQDADA